MMMNGKRSSESVQRGVGPMNVCYDLYNLPGRSLPTFSSQRIEGSIEKEKIRTEREEKEGFKWKIPVYTDK